jgi:murein DD-endopeptidase MepM/ murein hydrolase activator NlpD
MIRLKRAENRRTPWLVLAAFLLVIILGGIYFFSQGYSINLARTRNVLAWLRNPGAHSAWQVEAGQRCSTAPFLVPTSGFVGFLWDDSFRIGHRHQGVDIFGGDGVDVTPVIAAYSGYLTRQPDWKSSLIIRIPQDPLQPGRQIWTYYTHLADEQGNSFISDEFPAGTFERYVEAGTLLGYQGNYSGDPGNPVGVHLHFSIVLDDGQGNFLNELKIENTLDPSPYLGMQLNAGQNRGEIPLCGSDTSG